MNFKKSSIAFLVLGLSFMSCEDVLALTTDELNDYSLSVHGERIVGSSRLEDYLKKKSINIKEYNEYLKKVASYLNSKEYLWEQVENGSLLMDEIVFLDKRVRDEYDKALKKLGSKQLAYDFVKKNMINDPKMFIDIFESGMKDLKTVRAAYERKFKREINGFEDMFLNKLHTIKHGLYTGVNGGYLMFQDTTLSYDGIVDAIYNGEGYLALGLNASDIEKYMKFVEERSKYDKLMVPYIKAYSMFESISSEISGKYKKDIYKELTDNERMVIYKESLKGFIFDEEVAKKKVIDALISKKVLSKQDLVEENNSILNEGYNSLNPWVEANKLLKGDGSLGKFQGLDVLYDGKVVSHIFKNLDEKYVYIKYKDVDINTYLRVTKDGMLNSAMVMDLINLLDSELKLKTVLSKEEMLTFFENKINTFKLTLEEGKDIKFDKISKELKVTGIDIYLKDIDFETDEDVIEIGNEDMEEDKEIKYEMNIHLKDKLAVYELGDSNRIKVEDVPEILQSLDIRCIISRDSILVYKDGGLKVSKSFGLQDREITIDKFKALLDDIGEKVNINVIKETV